MLYFRTYPLIYISEGYKADGKHTEQMATVCCLELIFDKYNRSYSVNVSATYKNTFKHLFPSINLSSVVVNKLECLCINLKIVFVDAHELCHP